MLEKRYCHVHDGREMVAGAFDGMMGMSRFAE